MKIKFRNFTKPNLLKRINRDLLTRFFGQFNGLALPPPDLSDHDYFNSLARLFMSPESLPEPLTEALFAIDEMSCANAQAQLQFSPEWPAVQSQLAPESTPEEIALQIWLLAPELLARIHNSQRLKRLTTFEYFGGVEGRGSCNEWGEQSLTGLKIALDGWFSMNQRGHETTRIEVYPLDGELWFLVRHGDVFTRTPKVDAQKTEILHFRPERDDVIVFSPHHNEIRINARTKGERELYRREFGRHLRGSADYFSRRNQYTLEPLRADGPHALNASEIPGLGDIKLRALQISLDNGNNEVITTAADDLFHSGTPLSHKPAPIPRHGRLTRAIFGVHFAGCRHARVVELRPPNILKLSRRCDASLVHRWLRCRGFRLP